MRILTTYEVHTGKLKRPMELSVISDLHDEPYDDLFAMIEETDALLVPGDISDRYRQCAGRGIRFLREAAQQMPTFFSPGNHETRQKRYNELMKQVCASGAEVLVNRFVPFGELFIGGWYPPEIVRTPDMLNAFAAQNGVKVLLCHKPEHYFRYVRSYGIDLVVAGHAHGGQIRIGSQGLFAPGQGPFPRYTRGLYDDHLIVSAGVGNPVHLPRWGNPCEVLRIRID